MESDVCVQQTFSGVGLQSVVLSDLHPDEDYSVQIRCGAQQNFWKWGNWSEPFTFKTKPYSKGFFFFLIFFKISVNIKLKLDFF